MSKILGEKGLYNTCFFEWCDNLWKSELNILLEIRKNSIYFFLKVYFCIETKPLIRECDEFENYDYTKNFDEKDLFNPIFDIIFNFSNNNISWFNQFSQNQNETNLLFRIVHFKQ